MKRFSIHSVRTCIASAKRTIVRELKDTEHVVAMTGDGVNDVLALRADCSIAMAEGDGATRQISNLVLLDSDFKRYQMSCLKDGVW